MAKAKILLGAALVLGLGTPLILEHAKNRALRARTAALEQQIGDIQSDRESETSKLRALANEAAAVPALRAEIARLRGEIDRLKSTPAPAPQRVAAEPGAAGPGRRGPGRAAPRCEKSRAARRGGAAGPC